MLVCPECQGELVHNATERGYLWTCPRCNGRVFSLSVLRKEAGEDYAKLLVEEGRRAAGGLGRPCPMCGNYLVRITMSAEAEPYNIEVCKACQSLWISPEAYQRLPLAAPPAPQPAVAPASHIEPRSSPIFLVNQPARPYAPVTQPDQAPGPMADRRPVPSPPPERGALTQEQQEQIAALYAQTVANQMNSRDRTNPSEPEALWQRIAGYLGLPVLIETGLERTPRITYGLAAIIALVSLFVLYATDGETLVRNLAFIPAQPFRHYGLTFLTSFLLHSGLWHLLSNLYFLIVFGSSVEDTLGRREYPALILVAALVGEALHTAVDPRSTIPLVGASGGIAGLVVFFGLAFPRAKLGLALFFRVWIRIPALAFVLFWVLLQILGARAQTPGNGGVAYLVHLGGALVGLISGLVWRFTREEETGEAARA